MRAVVIRRYCAAAAMVRHRNDHRVARRTEIHARQQTAQDSVELVCSPLVWLGHPPVIMTGIVAIRPVQQNEPAPLLAQCTRRAGQHVIGAGTMKTSHTDAKTSCDAPR